ncbi:MAG: AAA family ATPase [Myxococcota bacterium]
MTNPHETVSRDIAVLSRAGYPLIYILTQEEARARRMVARAAAALRRQTISWSCATGFDREDLGRPLSAEAAFEAIDGLDGPSLVVMLDLHPFLREPAVVRRIRDRLIQWVERRQSVVLISSVLEVPPDLEKDCAVLDLPLPRGPELTEILSRVAASERCEISNEVSEKAVRSALGLTANEAERAFRKVIVLRKGLRESDLGLVVQEKRAALRSADALDFHDLGPGLADVGGLGELKRWLQARTRAFGAEARQFGLPAPKGLLLLGVQGCGKSLSAKAVAELWKFPLLRLDLSAVFAGGDTSPEASIRQAIRVAESLAPVVLWIDEIEKGFRQAEGDDSGSRVFGSFITWLAEKNAEVFVVATANDVSALPPELLRRGRFDEVFFVDLPNVHERREVLAIHLRRRGRNPEDFPGLEDLARHAEHFSGAELEQVVVAGLYRAFADGSRALTDQDLVLAMKQTVPLYATYEERIKALREWAKSRARPATKDATVLDLFGGA